MEKPIQINAFVTNRCNFTCAHCITSASPTSSSMELAPADVERLVGTINSERRVRRVSFIGGEPTIAVDRIESIQSQIVRDDIEYAITTNGWFADNPSRILDRIQIHNLIISFDRYHAPFITVSTLSKLIDYALQKRIRVTLNCVYSNPSELADVYELIKPGVTLQPIALVKGGRSEEPADVGQLRSLSRTCPSMDFKGYLKLTYLPGKGFSPCCGPLIFDSIRESEFSFSPEVTSPSPLARSLENSFSAQYESAGLAPSAERLHPCSLCVNLYGRTSAGIPLDELGAQKEVYKIYPLNRLLSKEHAASLSQSFHISYGLNASVGTIEKWKGDQIAIPDGIAVNVEPDVASIIEFIDLSFYQKYGDFFSALDRSLSKNYIESYFKEFNVVARTYSKNEKTVAMVMVHHDPSKPENAIGVGYWGYLQSELTVQEARAIKSHWLTLLREWAANRSSGVSLSVSWFNDSALRLVKLLGFEICDLRLRRRQGLARNETHSSNLVGSNTAHG